MIRKFSLFVLFSLLFFQSIASPSDSLIYRHELKFHSELEEQQFMQFLEHEDNMLEILMSISPEVTEANITQAKASFEGLLTYLKEKEVSSKRERRQAKLIYKEIHDRFFKHYELKNHFSNVFTNGRYNCVSGTAIYAMTFEHFGLPYEIKEAPEHVFMVAYPNSKSIKIEATTPEKGYVVNNKQLKENFVGRLIENKIIAESEAAFSTLDQLFNKYYYGDSHLSMRQLVAIQYANEAFFASEDEDFESALTFIEKAYYLDPSERHSLAMLSILASLAQKNELGSPVYPELIGKMSRYEEQGLTNQLVLHDIAALNQLYLVEKNDPEGLDKAYSSLRLYLKDSTLLHEAEFYFQFENGRILYNKGEYREALQYADSAFQLKPQHLDANTLLSSTLLQHARIYDRNPEQFIDLIEGYMNKHEGLRTDKDLKAMQLTSYLRVMAENFRSNRASKGEVYRKKFEQEYIPKEHYLVETEHISFAYSMAGTYYFKKQNDYRARLLFKQGLKYAPGDYNLRMRLQSM